MNIEIDGLNINYNITGDGSKALVMLQGWGTTYQVYSAIGGLLPDDVRFVQFDFPGFGESDEPDEPWDVDGYADFFCRFMEKLGIKKAILMGHSYGGRVIIKLATRKSLPFEIEKIILMDSAGVLPQRTFKQKLKIKRFKLYKKILLNKFVHALFPEIIDDWKSRQGSEDYRKASPIMKQCLVKAVNEDLTHLLPDIKQETLLIWGDADTATPIRDARIMDEKIPNSGLAVIEGAGHFPFLEKPAIFNSIIKSYFLNGDR